MSVTDAYDAAQATLHERAAYNRELSRHYQAVFFGTPQAADQQAVRTDLEAFCGMRTDLMRSTFEDTAKAIGQFRVWQRIVSFCFPRDGGENGQAQARDGSRRAGGPTPGGGVAERTLD